MRQVPKILIDFINHHDCFYILGHREPDGDCIGSQLALASMLQSMGKRVHVLSSGPFNRIEILRFEARFKSEVPSERDFERTAAIVLDCSSMERIGSCLLYTSDAAEDLLCVDIGGRRIIKKKIKKIKKIHDKYKT